MRCNKCNCSLPFDPDDLTLEYSCLYCDGTHQLTSKDYLSRADLGIVTESRSAQIQFSDVVSQAYRQDQVVMVEAGTGVGKSWAYLLPAILSGSRTVISTAKKSLQSQLIKKDLPYLQSKLGIPFTFAPAYGKSNYACMKEVRAHTKPAEYKRTWEWFFEYAPTARWAEIQEAQARYRAKEVTKRKIQLPVAKTRLSAEKCESRNCKYTADCKYLAARQKVHEAHIVVANHWLVGFHLRLRREISEYGLLGEMPYLIVDEAHKFEDGVRAAFTHEIHEAALPQLIRDFENLGEYTKIT